MQTRSLHEIFKDIWNNKGEIKGILEDIGLDQTELDQDGSVYGVWQRAVGFVARKGKLQELVDRAKTRASAYATELDSALQEYQQAQVGRGAKTSKKEWPIKAYCSIDRKAQVDGFDKHIAASQPFVMVWCGDEPDRHDILRERLNSYQPRMCKKWELKVCSCNEFSDIDYELTRICRSLIGDEVSDAECFRMLMTGRDYSNHLIAIDVDLEWSDHPAKSIDAIARWCERLGDMANDRRFVVRVAVTVSKRSWQFCRFWVKPEALFKANCAQLAASLVDLKNVVSLEPLGSIELKHLKFWRNEMFNEYHPREDDELGDTRLLMIVPEKTQRFMDEVVRKLEPILKR